jgi:hypothetical protein
MLRNQALLRQETALKKVMIHGKAYAGMQIKIRNTKIIGEIGTG